MSDWPIDNDVPAPGIGHNSGAGDGWGNPEPVEAAPPVQTYEIKYIGQPATEEPEAFRLRRNAEIQTWLDAKPILQNAKTIEMDLRNRVTQTLFPAPVKGTQRYDIGGGYKVKLVYGLTYTLGNKDLTDEAGQKVKIKTQIERLEEQITTAYPLEGPLLLERLISWEPKLSGSEYEKLNPDNPAELAIRTMIDDHLTIKPSSPTLDFEEPKER